MPPSNRENTGAVLITGASTGIGAACALHLDRLGHRVFAGVRKPEDGEALRSRGSASITPVTLDVTKPEQIADAARLVEEATGVGGLGGLVNNAGIAITGPLEFVEVDRLRRQLEVNVIGQIEVTQAFLPLIRRGPGRVVNMGSLSGIFTPPFFGPYSASKHALEALTDALRQELAPWGVRVSIIEPGVIQTPIWEKGLEELDAVRGELPEHGRRLYAPFMDPALDRVMEDARHGIQPEKVAEAVAHAIRARRPKTRYLVGRDAQLTARLARLLPDRWQDPITRRMLKMPARPPR
jgi:NAD(P)-dependent dehydrogenase (short-subunit alcohol dehydrogenase family)